MKKLVTVLLLALSLSTGYAQTSKKEFVFHGKVEKIDAKARTITVNGEKVDGWMGAMTMLYKVDGQSAIDTLKAGDQIVAKVYEGDFTTLHNVQLASAEKK
jgi:Cu/Ag efflux protein CusF